MQWGKTTMKKVDASEILDLTAYERIRPRFVAEMIEYKRPRRVHVGEALCFVFENRRTVLFQLQEMTRAERTVDPQAIALELDVYNELVPGDDELSATLMIEIPDRTKIRAELDRLIGIDEHVCLDFSLPTGSATVRASFDPKQFEADRISAVQYIRFPLGAELARQFRDESVSVALRVDHPSYSSKTPITGECRRALIEDLSTP
jgi:hypothetical protein